jgi:hypothetical protein
MTGGAAGVAGGGAAGAAALAEGGDAACTVMIAFAGVAVGAETGALATEGWGAAGGGEDAGAAVCDPAGVGGAPPPSFPEVLPGG